MGAGRCLLTCPLVARHRHSPTVGLMRDLVPCFACCVSSVAKVRLIQLGTLMGLQQRLVEAFCCPSRLPVSTAFTPGPVEVYD